MAHHLQSPTLRAYERVCSVVRFLSVLFFLSFAIVGKATAQEQVVLFPGVTGNALIDSLRHHYKPDIIRSYNEARDSMFMSFNYVDGAIECFFTGDTIRVSQSNARILAQNRGFNTEHLWPQSKFLGRGNAYSDLHHLRPSRADVNQSRNNFRFKPLELAEVTTFWRGRINQSSVPAGDLGEWSKTKQGTTYVDSFFEPRDIVKGDVARAMFYFYTMYEDEALATDRDFFSDQMSDLLSFHQGDPVDMAEYLRTFKIASIQSGKANPFILDSTLVARAFFTDYDGPKPPALDDGRFFAEYSFSGTASCNDEDVEPTRQSTGITFSSFYRVGVNCNTVSSAFNSNGWPSDYSSGHFVGFKAEAAPDNTVGFTSSDTLRAFVRRSGTGPSNYRIFLTTDGETVLLREGNLAVANSTIELKIGMPAMEGNTTFEIRVHAWGASSPNGTFRISALSLGGIVEDTNMGTGLHESPTDSPTDFMLYPAYPNPFNPVTIVPFSLGKTDYVKFYLYDMLGRQLKELASGPYAPGTHHIPVAGENLSSGVYIVRMIGSEVARSIKITLLK
jgi:endonuclease I